MSTSRPFVLNPKNQPFVDGLAPHPAAPRTNRNIVLPLVGLACVAVGGLNLGGCLWLGIVEPVRHSPELAPSLVAQVILLTLVVVYFAIWLGCVWWLTSLVATRSRLREALMQQGHLIQGTIVWCKGNVESFDGSSIELYIVTVTYEFQSPTSQTLWSRGSVGRNDLRGQPLPGPGTPVLILYLDDQNYALM
jgi:hypothetical protein